VDTRGLWIVSVTPAVNPTLLDPRDGRPGWQGFFMSVVQFGRVQSYVRPLCAAAIAAIGVLNATALAAAIGEGQTFARGREETHATILRAEFRS
jgi:hypothetical protein